jgi:hypothetical protein
MADGPIDRRRLILGGSAFYLVPVAAGAGTWSNSNGPI